VHQTLREKLSVRDESVAHLKDELTAANRRLTSADDELTHLRTSMHGLDNQLLAKTMSLGQAAKVRRMNNILQIYSTNTARF